MPTLHAGLRRRGVYALGRYNVLHVAPPLVIGEAELDEAIAALDGAIGDLTRSYEGASAPPAH
jgi:taurine--2-oxoglutarate transaminase